MRTDIYENPIDKKMSRITEIKKEMVKLDKRYIKTQNLVLLPSVDKMERLKIIQWRYMELKEELKKLQ